MNRSAAVADITFSLPPESPDGVAATEVGWHDAAVIPVVVDASFVAAHPDAVLADVRWYLDGRDGRAAYEAGHLPGAVWVDLDRQLAGRGLPDVEGRHPFPSPPQFAEAMSSLGIGDDTVVVAYDDTGGLTAGRLVVMLRMLGHDAAMLDGGLRRWTGDLAQGRVDPTPASFSERHWPADRLVDADTTAAFARGGVGGDGVGGDGVGGDGVVIDARVRERFTGEATQIDPRPGHVPGARSAPWSDVLDPVGTLRSRAELRDHYGRLGIGDHTETIAYCGSGVSACMNIVAMEHAGLTPPRLYVASWSGWSSDPSRPAQVGE